MRPGNVNIMFCPSVASCFSWPLRKPSPNPTRSSREPTPQAMPNMVRNERSLCAHRVDSDCRTMSRSMRIEIGRFMPPRLRGGAWGHPGNVQARGLNPALTSDQNTQPGSIKFPAVFEDLDPGNTKRLARERVGWRVTGGADVKFAINPPIAVTADHESPGGMGSSMG